MTEQDYKYYLDLGIQKTNEGKFEEALDALEKSLELKPNHALTHFSKGIVYQEIPLTENINNNDVYVGRIRKCSHNSLMFYCTSNNIRKGAAGNAFQIIKKIIEENLLFK